MRAAAVLLIVALLVGTGAHVAGAWPSVKRVDTTTYALGASGSIAVQDSSGDIELSGWDQDSVEVTTTRTAWSDDDLAKLKAQADSRPDDLSLRAQYPNDCFNCDISFSIRAPRGAHVTIDSASGDVTIVQVTGPTRIESSSGDVELRQIGGEAHVHSSSGSVTIEGAARQVQADTASGDIDASGLDGDADLVSSSGDVKAEFTSFASVRTVRLESTSGDLDFVVPRGAGFRVDASTSSGDIHSNLALPIDDRDSGADVSAQVGSGAATVQLRATSGDIHVTMR